MNENKIFVIEALAELTQKICRSLRQADNRMAIAESLAGAEEERQVKDVWRSWV